MRKYQKSAPFPWSVTRLLTCCCNCLRCRSSRYWGTRMTGQSWGLTRANLADGCKGKVVTLDTKQTLSHSHTIYHLYNVIVCVYLGLLSSYQVSFYHALVLHHIFLMAAPCTCSSIWVCSVAKSPEFWPGRYCNFMRLCLTGWCRSEVVCACLEEGPIYLGLCPALSAIWRNMSELVRGNSHEWPGAHLLNVMS